MHDNLQGILLLYLCLFSEDTGHSTEARPTEASTRYRPSHFSVLVSVVSVASHFSVLLSMFSVASHFSLLVSMFSVASHFSLLVSMFMVSL